MYRSAIVAAFLHYLSLMRTNCHCHRFQATTKEYLTLHGGLENHTLCQVKHVFEKQLAQEIT